jgi:hypothetical protein
VNPITQLARDVQDLHVKPKAFNSLQGEDAPSAVASETLQPTLRILYSWYGEKLNNQVEHASHQVSVIRLPDPTCTQTLAGCNDDVMLNQHIRKAGQIFRGHRQIGVTEENLAPSSR